MPKVSVIIPTYNRAETILRSVRSILNQTYQDFELIIIDDASTDDTKEIIGSIGDKRIRYIRLEQNGGVSHARNVGMKEARGEFIAFNDSDDEWLPRKLETQIHAFEADPSTGLVYTLAARIKGKRFTFLPDTRFSGSSHDPFESLLTYNYIAIQTVVLRKVVLDMVGGFDESIDYGEDWDLFLRIVREFSIKRIDTIFVKYQYDTPTSLTSVTYKKKAEARERVYRKHWIYFTDRPRILAVVYARIGHFYLLGGEMQKGRRNLYRSLQKKLKIKNVTLFVVSFFGHWFYMSVFKLGRFIYDRTSIPIKKLGQMTK